MTCTVAHVAGVSSGMVAKVNMHVVATTHGRMVSSHSADVRSAQKDRYYSEYQPEQEDPQKDIREQGSIR